MPANEPGRYMMPGEAQAYEAYRTTRDVVEYVASKNMGFDPDSGFRPATAQERIAEWDGLSPEQRNAIIANKGIQWYISQAAEIEVLRTALSDITPPDSTATAPPGSAS